MLGQALFDWEKDDDKNIILGNQPFEFGIIENSPSHLLSDIQSILDAETQKRKMKQKKAIQKNNSV